ADCGLRIADWGARACCRTVSTSLIVRAALRCLKAPTPLSVRAAGNMPAVTGRMPALPVKAVLGHLTICSSILIPVPSPPSLRRRCPVRLASSDLDYEYARDNWFARRRSNNQVSDNCDPVVSFLKHGFPD